MRARGALKAALAAPTIVGQRQASGATLLTYHRVGGGSGDELDVATDDFERQMGLLAGGAHEVVPLDVALDRLDVASRLPSVVLTFDDGFRDVYENAWPVLRAHRLPFTLYLAAGLVGDKMRWEGSTAASQGAPALTWDQVGELHESGLCTVANHTWDHPGPDQVDEDQLDRCNELIEARLGERPRHFAWTWGVEVPRLKDAVAARFRSIATGQLGRNLPGVDQRGLRRVPVRATDPITFYRAKLHGRLLPERAYASLVAGAKWAQQGGAHG